MFLGISLTECFWGEQAAGLEYDTNRINQQAGAASSRPDFVGLMWPGPTPFETKASQLDSGASRLVRTQAISTTTPLSGLALTDCLRFQHGMSPLSLELDPSPPPVILDDVPPSFHASAGTGDRIHAM